jgi:NDP-sugar pyrophosphorylase family protein
MKAMVLAAGLGTRLRPLTDTRPKALVEIGGRTLLEITLARLREFGICEVVVNAHHYADTIVDYLKANRNFGMHLEVSRETTLLDTGGGLKKAAGFFLNSSENSDEPFILHNVDILSNVDLRRMTEFHHHRQALATLAVQQRDTSRYLLFDDHGQLCGRRAGRHGEPELARPAPHCHALAFCGIHVISPRLLALLEEEGAFPIIPCYLRLSHNGEKILGFLADQYHWRDVGRTENLAQAEHDLRQQTLSLG